ncbi:MAG: hypothetical protein ACRCZT_04040 [Plesiomonas sp.]
MMKLNVLTLAMLMSGAVTAADLYDPTKSYPGGEQATLNNNLYETQWWANPGESPANITANAWESPWVFVSEVDNGEPPATETQVTDIGYFERTAVITGNDINLDELNISAVERYQDRIYLAHDAKPGTVIILDANSHEKIGEIDGVSSGLAAYVLINELYIEGNRLFVTSLSSNRVDIYDLDNNHKHIMSLGKGVYWGDNRLLHPQSVASSDDYIMVADSSNIISVYRQEDAIAANHYRAPQLTYLEFEGNSTSRKIQMHVLDNYLLVATANKNYFIYDLNKVAAAVSAGEYLKADQRIDVRIQKIDREGDQLIINKDGRIEWHNINDVIANNFQFIAPTKTVTNLDGAWVGSLNDLHFIDQSLITATATELRFYEQRSTQVSFVAGEQVDTTKLKLSQVMPSAIREILTLDEPHSILTDPKLRSVKVNSPVKTEFVDTKTVQITNYAPVELSDLTLELKLAGTDKWFTLAQLDSIPPYTQITLPLSAFGEGKFNTTDATGVMDLSDLFASSMNFSNEFDYRFNSLSDAFAQKLASLLPTWTISFAAESHGKWRKMNALYAREWIVILTNLAYMVSEDEFKHVWFNFEKIFGYNMHGNAGEVHEPNGYFTSEDYQYYYTGLLNRPSVKGGVTLMGGGQADQWVTGVDTWLFYSHYYGDWGVIAHEFGHGFDGKNTYHHHTSFANGGNGWHPLMSALANYHIRKGDLPYMDDNITGFYKPEHAPYQYVATSNGQRKHRADSHMNNLDDYFMTFSTMPRGWSSKLGADGQVNANPMALELNNQERLLVANYPMAQDKPNLCRFTFEDGEQYFGYIEQQGEQSRCNAGSNISYRQADGTKVKLVSKTNDFEWLSLYNPEKAGEPVLHQNGKQLCQINVDGFYGTGFVNDGKQCVQLPNVYWSNGNRWVFSSKWTPITYSTSNWVAPK